MPGCACRAVTNLASLFSPATAGSVLVTATDASTSQEGSSDDEASDMEGTTSADEESMDDCTDSADDTTSSAAGPDEAADDDPCGSHCAGCLGTATGLAHSSHAEQESVQEVWLPAGVC